MPPPAIHNQRSPSSKISRPQPNKSLHPAIYPQRASPFSAGRRSFTTLPAHTVGGMITRHENRPRQKKKKNRIHALHSGGQGPSPKHLRQASPTPGPSTTEWGQQIPARPKQSTRVGQKFTIEKLRKRAVGMRRPPTARKQQTGRPFTFDPSEGIPSFFSSRKFTLPGKKKIRCAVHQQSSRPPPNSFPGLQK